jgi:uncharacterized protein with von Willebrand factor type A (vWA) domain
MGTRRDELGGIIHSYQKYDPRNLPGPGTEPPDMVSPALEHMLLFGHLRKLSPEELARAVRLDPSQIRGLGPSIDGLIEMLLARKRRILETYETGQAERLAGDAYRTQSAKIRPPKPLRTRYHLAVRDEQLRDLERLWYASGDEQSAFARGLVQLVERLGEKYQIEELSARYEFTGHTPMDVPQALAIKEELEEIDKLLEQLRQAKDTAQIGVIDLESLAEFAEPGDMDQLRQLQQQIADYLRHVAEGQGLEFNSGQFRLTPRAQRLFQGRLLERIFSALAPSRSGRHVGPILGEGAVETQKTRAYQFGDSVTHMDIPATFVNAMVRAGTGLPVRIQAEDIQIHETRNAPRCATCVLLDMSGSMRYGGQYVHVKRMGLALEGLIRREYPGDHLQFLEMYTFAKPCRTGELVNLMPKPVTLFDPVIRLRADMSRPEITELDVPPHFTNIQHGLAMARRYLSLQPTVNRQVILITDGLPTAHFEGEHLYLLYPPDSRTEAATLREGQACRRDGITINIFLLPGWAQSEEDIRFAYRLAESTAGRVFFTAGHDLDRYVVWDYLQRRREILA